jgi:hypothetical protein
LKVQVFVNVMVWFAFDRTPARQLLFGALHLARDAKVAIGPSNRHPDVASRTVRFRADSLR